MNQKRQAAKGKILRRCTICKKFHAEYVVEIPELGKYYHCYSCWKARQSEEKVKSLPEAAEKPKTTNSPS